MTEANASFRGQSFLEKEATPNVGEVLGTLKGLVKKIGPRESNPAVIQEVRNNNPLKPSIGTFVNKPSESTINPEKLNVFDKDEVVNKAKDEMKHESSGSFILDGLLGLSKKIAPKSKEPIENAVVKTKGALEGTDTMLGSLLAGKNPNSMRGKLFSTKVQRHVGDVENENGSLSHVLREDRRPSIVAPISNSAKVATPLLAAAYVGSKLYPTQNVGQNGNQTPYEPNITKQASELENEIFDLTLVNNMDKTASMQKIAELQENLSKYANQLEEALIEKTAAEKRIKEISDEKAFFEKRASLAEQNLLEKEADFQELKLRTIAQKRSKVAVDLAEQMLTCGFIKQAELKGMTDDLMECDEGTIKRYQSLVKNAKTKEESLESLAVLVEYKGNEKLASSSKDLAPNGLSKRGQSIGEAARDLINK